jgi:hypothetical protein
MPLASTSALGLFVHKHRAKPDIERFVNSSDVADGELCTFVVVLPGMYTAGLLSVAVFIMMQVTPQGFTNNICLFAT